jgi:hypothetical protein
VLRDQLANGVHALAGGVERSPGLAVLDQPPGISKLRLMDPGPGKCFVHAEASLEDVPDIS